MWLEGQTMKAITRILGLFAVLAFAGAAAATPLTAGGNYAGTSHIDENHSVAALNNIVLDNATLTGTNFRQTNFSFGSFISANFNNSAIGATNLRQTNFTGANMTSATFVNANLNLTNFSGANLAGANFTGATNGNTANFTGATYNASTILPTGITAAQLGSMTFVPEPSTAMMLFAGLGGLAALGSRRNAPRRS
jgi:uncharacterized protein YjbI with pentapeptide repeats